MTSTHLLPALSVFMIYTIVEPFDSSSSCSKMAGLGGSAEAAQAQGVSGRLAMSQYVVRDGALTRRPGSAATTSGPLSPGEEFAVVKKGLEELQAMADVPDGSVVIVVDGSEYYEVTISNPLQAGNPYGEEVATIMVDKNSRTAARVALNTKQADERIARRLALYRDLAAKQKTSEYVVRKGVLTRRPGGVARPLPSLNRDKAFAIMKKGIEALQKTMKWKIPDGTAVVLLDGPNYYEVVIGDPLPPGVLGGDYLANVTIDKTTLGVVQILGG
jgi:hypothetical protein